MKNNQTDLIVKIVAILLALIACGVIISNQPQPFSPSDPVPAPAVNVVLPPGTVVKTNGLPNAGDANAAGQSGVSGTPPASGGGGQFQTAESGRAGR